MKLSLDEVINNFGDEGWWRGTRGMRLCVTALVNVMDIKYIIPTRISMVYGIVEKIKKDE